MNLHQDLKDLFGTVNNKEIPLVENLGSDVFSEEVIDFYSRCISAFNRKI